MQHQRVVIGKTGFAARVQADGTLAGVDVTNCLCRGLSSLRPVDTGAKPRTETVVVAANGDDAFAMVVGDRTIAVFATTNGAVKWATTMPDGFIVNSVALFSAESAAAVLNDGRVALMVPNESPVRCPTAGGITAAAAVTEDRLVAVAAGSKQIQLLSLADDGVSTVLEASVPYTTAASKTDTVVSVNAALTETNELGCVAVTYASGTCHVVDASGSTVSTSNGATAVAAIGPSAFAVCCGLTIKVVAVRNAAQAAASPGKGRKSAGSSKPAAEADVVTLTVPAGRFPAAAITGAAMSIEGDRLQLAGCVGVSGLAAAALAVDATSTVAASILGDLADESATGAMWGSVDSLADGVTTDASGALRGRPMATCNYVCVPTTVEGADGSSAAPPLVTAVTTTLAIHARRARDRDEIRALAHLLRESVATSYSVAGAPVQWNHNLLRGAMKMLGTHGARSAVLSAADACVSPSTDFVTAVSSCANAVGAGVTLQQQLGFRLQLPQLASGSGVAVPTPTAAELSLQMYGRMLAAGRSLSNPCASMAARWSSLISDAERRGVKPVAAAQADETNDNTAADSTGAASSSTGAGVNRAAGKRTKDSKAMRQVHGGGGMAETRQGGGSDTVAAKVRGLMGSLPAEVQAPNSVFRATAKDATDTPVHRAVRSRIANRNLTAYERATLGMAPK